MSENTGVEPTATTEENGGSSAEETTVDYKAKYEEAIGQARKWEGRAKSNKAAADELEQLKDAQKSDAEKTADRIKALEAENAKYKHRDEVSKWSAEIVKDSDIPASVLRGNTREELAEHFEQLKALAPVKRQRKSPAPTGDEDGQKTSGLKAHEALKRLK